MTRLPTKLLFFDLPTQIHLPTSPNTWKVRLVLNFKQLSYTTHWTPTSCATQTAVDFGIPPSGTHPDGRPHYTLPALIDYTPEIPVKLSDSTRIIDYLERTYPTPDVPVDDEDAYPYPRSLFPAGSRALHALVERHILAAIRPPLYDLFTVALWRTKLSLDQGSYIERKTRAKGVRTLEELQINDAAGREVAWGRLREGFRVLAQIAEIGETYAHARGEKAAPASTIPVFQSPHVTYADLALCSLLVMGKLVSPDEFWPRLKEWDGGRWEQLHDEVFSRWGYVHEKMEVSL
ncbi:hypothetical protein K488DRAFT_56702 [Vararia minispora EC-137]|uniref:Uncharacterized protein n=1 Tax=Vararia minispora EC-137 TaxID=1314806 RepID=A0ACB8QCA4_9AGAM|nr:hypothetical protein K488DRAFT_56702 [Vararia minispora EC-137]